MRPHGYGLSGHLQSEFIQDGEEKMKNYENFEERANHIWPIHQLVIFVLSPIKNKISQAKRK
jgi:predicted AAA+ superfamily ATPase